LNWSIIKRVIRVVRDFSVSLLIPMSSVTAIPTVPGELFAKFQTGFYSDPIDAVFKALRVN
jgi:predicted ATP-dependent Lon-type protease